MFPGPTPEAGGTVEPARRGLGFATMGEQRGFPSDRSPPQLASLPNAFVHESSYYLENELIILFKEL